jgi:hypothetical protein
VAQPSLVSTSPVMRTLLILFSAISVDVGVFVVGGGWCASGVRVWECVVAVFGGGVYGGS